MPHIKNMGAVSRAGVNHSIILTEEQQDYICHGIVLGIAVKKLCQELNLHPVHVYDYAFKDPLFDKRMRSARVYNAHLLVDELLKCTEGAETIAQTQRARVWSDNAKWIASKIDPKSYGDNLNVNVSHHLDLSSILLAAENRVLPLLQAKNALLTANPERTASTIAPGEAIDIEVIPEPARIKGENEPIAPVATSINDLSVPPAIASAAAESAAAVAAVESAAAVAIDATGAIPKGWI